MNKNIFFILPVLFIIFSSPSFSSPDVKATSSHPTTTTIISPSNSTVAVGKSITFHAKVADYVPPESTPYGTVTWSDGGKGGKFNSTSCTLVFYSSNESICSVAYTPSSAGLVTITAAYGGGGFHASSSASTPLTVTLRTSTSTITPNPATVTAGKAITFSTKVNDPGTGTKTPPTGIVTWSDGGKGGKFNSTSCTLTIYSTSASTCSISYTPSIAGSVTINGTYGGKDGVHAGSFGLTSLTVTLRTSTTTISGPVNATIGTLTTFYAKVNDPGTGTKTPPTGIVTWSDGGKGGIFSASSCILAPFKGSSSESICSVTYTRSTAGSITITGTYGGDSSHSGSFGTLGFKVY